MGRHKIYQCLRLLARLLAVFLTACGSKGRTLGIDGFVYVAEEVPIPGIGSARNFKMQDDYLYYQIDKMVYRLAVEEFMEGQKASSFGEPVFTGSTAGGNLWDFTLDSSGGYYALMDLTWKGEVLRSALVKQRADGTEIYRLDLGKRDIANVSLAVDGDGRAFLLTKEGLYAADAEGNLMAEIPGSKLGVEFAAGSGRLLEGEAGSVYYSPSDYYNVVYEISGDDEAFREGTFQMKRIELPSSGRCYSAPEGILCGGGDGMLYQYKENGAKWDTLLRFSDSSLMQQPQQMLRLSGEILLAHYDNYPDRELFLLTKTDVSLLPEEEELVLAALALPTELEKYIAEFSRSSGCHVTVEYYQGENWAARLDAAMVSSNPPDLIVLEDETVMKFAEKGILEDLAPYLESSTALDREDFLENLLEGYTIGGKLSCIPDSFFIYTAVGRTSQLGTEAGWTAEDVMDFAVTHPEANVFRTPTFTSMMAFFQEYILESYIDWKSGECSFDEEEFRVLIKWIAEHCDGFGSGYSCDFDDSWDSDGEMIPEAQLLSPECFMAAFPVLLEYELRFGEDVTAIGYPTCDGRAFHTVHANNRLGIAAGSSKKEKAWQFIEGFLVQENKFHVGGFPSRKDLLVKMAEEERVENFLDDGAGNITKKTKGGFLIGGERISYDCMTQEQTDMVMGIIEAADFTPRIGGLRYDIMGILLEELEPYIEGKQTLEESTRILQNRVRNLVQENL